MSHRTPQMGLPSSAVSISNCPPNVSLIEHSGTRECAGTRRQGRFSCYSSLEDIFSKPGFVRLCSTATCIRVPWMCYNCDSQAPLPTYRPRKLSLTCLLILKVNLLTLFSEWFWCLPKPTLGSLKAAITLAWSEGGVIRRCTFKADGNITLLIYHQSVMVTVLRRKFAGKIQLIY